MTAEKLTEIRNQRLRMLAILYIAIGIVQIGYFSIENSNAPPNILILGILSIIVAYPILTQKKWSLPIIVGLFFVGITFGITTLFHSIVLQTFSGALLFHLTLIAYVIVMLISSIYIISQRDNFN